MLDILNLSKLPNSAIVAPAGHGKTELLAKLAACHKRSLILTHTHAGVHVIRSRLKRMGIPQSKVAVDTIAGWSMRYTHAFPKVSKPSIGMPSNSAEWEQLYTGCIDALDVRAIQDIVKSSYDRIMVDEYQDCNQQQHALILKLSSIVPTTILGDPMQGIFEFAGATLSWEGLIYNSFPLALELTTPHRWAGKNIALGEWISCVRSKLMRGEVIDLEDAPIDFRQSSDAFEMGAFFEGLEDRKGTHAAIHCNKNICYRLAQATSGGYQAIEEMAASRIMQFATAWDNNTNLSTRQAAVNKFIDDCFNKKPNSDPAEESLKLLISNNLDNLVGNTAFAALNAIFSISRQMPNWKLYRGEAFRDVERMLLEVTNNRATSMQDAASIIRQRVTNTGRHLPTRTVSTPLLLKGLEFDHVLIPDASHFKRENLAQAKLFYVAISRATTSLKITASSRYLQFPIPRI